MSKKPEYKSKTPKVYKNKKLNNANFGDYNLNDYQVFLQFVSKVGGVDQTGKYLQASEIERTYTLKAQEFSDIFKVDINTTYRVLKTAGKRLARTAITLEKPTLFTTQEIPVCSFAEYNNREGSLTIEFNVHIMPYITQLKDNWLLYNLKELANFGSLYTTRLYEIIQEFKDTGYIVKSVDQLREIFAVGNKYPQYKNFKAKTFVHAINEINSQYDMNLTFKEMGQDGKEVKPRQKVVVIQFFFKKTIIHKTIDPYTGKDKNIYIKPKAKPRPAQVTQQPLFSDTDVTIESVNEKLKNKDLERSFINPREAKTIKEVAQVAAHNFAAQTAGIIEIKNGIKKLIQKIKDVDFRKSCELTLDQMDDEAEIRAFNGDVTKYLLKN